MKKFSSYILIIQLILMDVVFATTQSDPYSLNCDIQQGSTPSTQTDEEQTTPTRSISGGSSSTQQNPTQDRAPKVHMSARDAGIVCNRILKSLNNGKWH